MWAALTLGGDVTHNHDVVWYWYCHQQWYSYCILSLGSVRPFSCLSINVLSLWCDNKWRWHQFHQVLVDKKPLICDCKLFTNYFYIFPLDSQLWPNIGTYILWPKRYKHYSIVHCISSVNFPSKISSKLFFYIVIVMIGVSSYLLPPGFTSFKLTLCCPLVWRTQWFYFLL